jgi:hypothetical protein
VQCPALRRIYWTSRQTPEAYVLDILYGMTEAEEQARGKFTTLEEAMESRSGGAFFLCCFGASSESPIIKRRVRR